MVLRCTPGSTVLDAPQINRPVGTTTMSGRLEEDRLVECSGLDRSIRNGNLFWAINDGGYGPYLYAVGHDGSDLGRIMVKGAQNRDWEGLDTFTWQERPMILIGDFGDNKEQYQTHTLYIVEEPELTSRRFDETMTVPVHRALKFSYADGPHDAEGVSVDEATQQILILTKRDRPPMMFSIPLASAFTEAPAVAHQVSPAVNLPVPPPGKASFPYGKYAVQPTAMDISADGRQVIILTYGDAYKFVRKNLIGWKTVFSAVPERIPLPDPGEYKSLFQREAICFGADDRTLVTTSEGRHAGIFITVLK